MIISGISKKILCILEGDQSSDLLSIHLPTAMLHSSLAILRHDRYQRAQRSESCTLDFPSMHYNAIIPLSFPSLQCSHTAPFTVSLHSIHWQNFCRGSPPTTSFNQSTSSDPTRENFQHGNCFVLSTRSSQKPQNFQFLHAPVLQIEAAVRGKRLSIS